MFFDGLKSFTFGKSSTIMLFRTNNLLRTVFNYRRSLLEKCWRAVLAKAQQVAIRHSSRRRARRAAPAEATKADVPREVLIINSGAWKAKTFVDSGWGPSAASFWQATAVLLQAHFRSEGLLMFRTLYTGQEQCEGRSKPFSSVEMVARHNDKLPYSWGSFASWNDNIAAIFRQTEMRNFFVFNVTMFSARGDGRKVFMWHQEPMKGGEPACCDCLHFVQPGPLVEMKRIMFHSVAAAFEELSASS